MAVFTTHLRTCTKCKKEFRSIGWMMIPNSDIIITPTCKPCLAKLKEHIQAFYD